MRFWFVSRNKLTPGAVKLTRPPAVSGSTGAQSTTGSCVPGSPRAPTAGEDTRATHCLAKLDAQTDGPAGARASIFFATIRRRIHIRNIVFLDEGPPAMKKLTAVLCALTSTLAVAATPTDKDGVPIVDLHGTIVQTSDAKIIAAAKRYGLRVPSQRMIAVGDRQMPLDEFLRTYCLGKPQNATCARGGAIARIDSSKGPQADLPKGL